MKIKRSNIHLGIWFVVITSLLCSIALGVALAVPVTEVSTEAELRAAIGQGSAAGNIKLTRDISLEQRLILSECPSASSSDKTVVIDLAGHNLQAGSDNVRKNSIFVVPNGYTLTIRDTSGRNSGSVTGAARAVENSGLFTLMSGGIRGNSGKNDGNGIYNNEGGVVTISGGVIENNTAQADHDGAGIYNRGQLQVTGGTIQNNSTNTAKDSGGYGGAIYNSKKGNLTISGGTIQKNAAERGGGIYNKSNSEMMVLSGRSKIQENSATTDGGAIYNESSSDSNNKFSMMGGIITKNTATNGAGIYNAGNMAVSAGNINGNIASALGGGIYHGNTLLMSGSIVVKGNKGEDDVDNDVYIKRDKVIQMENAFTRNAKVGIVCDRPNPVFTLGYKAYNPDAADDAFFFPNPNGNQTDTRIMIDPKTDSDELRCFVVLHCDDPHGGEQVVFEYFDIESGMDSWGSWGKTQWAAVRKDVKIKDNIGVRGDFNLILCTGARLTTEEIGVRRNDDKNDTRAHLIIWNTTGGDGALTADGSDSSSAGIGFKANSGGVGKITINGGNIVAFGGGDSAGIGGTENRGNGPIIINGGTVRAKGGKYGAGIGAGQGGDQDNYIHIYGGTVEAYGGKNAAGIGAGDSDRGGADGGKTVIRNAKVYAYGGDDAAGIGGGQDGDGAKVTISNSYVEAYGGEDGAGIGAGCEGDWGGYCRIEGGSTVIAQGGKNSAGIGGGYDACGGTFEIDNSTLYAIAGKNCADAIGAGHKDYHEGTKSIGSNLKVTAGSSEASATIRLADNRVKACFNPYVAIEPCDHPDSSVSYQDNLGPENHTAEGGCLYCNLQKTSNIEPHHFESSNHACVCGHVEDAISFQRGEDGLTVQTIYQSRGSNYTLTVARPSDVNTIFGGWKVSGLDSTLNPGINEGDVLSAGTSFVVAAAPGSSAISFVAQWIPASEHVHGLSHVDEVSPTCIDPGVAEHWVCDQGNSPCGNYFKDSEGLNPVAEHDIYMAPLGHQWGEPQYDWDDEYTRCTAHIECLRNASHNESVEAIVLPPVEKEPTCTKKGGKFVNAVFFTSNPQIHSQQHYFETIESTGHLWASPTYEWSEDHGTCTGQRICEHDASHKDSEEAQVTITSTDATCTKSGHIEVNATFTNPVFEDQEWHGVGTDPYGHDWNVPQYTWSDDLKKCMAIRTCKNYPLHMNLERSECTLRVDVEPTCTEPGQVTRIADFAASYFEEQTLSEPTSPLGHQWSDWHIVGEYVPGAALHTEERHCLREGCDASQERTIPGDGHNHALQQVREKAPTCTQSGIKFDYWICPECGRLYSDKEGINEIAEADVIAPPIGHLWTTPSYVWSADYSACIAKRFCIHNALHFQIEVGEVTSQERRAPTCTTFGSIEHVASFTQFDFQKQVMIEPTAALGHDWQDWNIVSDPTCTEPGSKTRTCNRNASHVETQAIPALGHTWGDWTVLIPPTETREGKEMRTCLTNPSHTQTRSIARIGHKHYLTKVDKIDPTCTEDGQREYWICEKGNYPCSHIFSNSAGVEELNADDLIVPALGHDWQEPTYTWNADNTRCTAVRVCNNNPAEIERETVETNSNVEKEPTCTEVGKTTFTAHFDNPAFIDQIKIAITAEHGHKAGGFAKENIVEPTCVNAGSHDEVTLCTICSERLDIRPIVDAPLGHDWTDWEKVQDESGDTLTVEKRSCKRVGCTAEERREISTPLGHEHDWGDWVVAVEPTCTTEGERKAACKIPGCSVTKTESIPSIGHKYGTSTYIDILEPGCTSYGYVIYLDRCVYCDKLFDGHLGKINPIQNDWGEWHVTKEATEEASGEKERICHNNEAHKETIVTNPIGHTWTDWAVVTAPTETSEGLEKRMCTGCGAEEYRKTQALFRYIITVAEKGIWKKGTEAPLILNLRRTFQNQETYDLFSSIHIDGKWVPVNSINGITYFAIRNGISLSDESSNTGQGLELIILPDFLERLPVGNHTITVRFTDGLTMGIFGVQAADPSVDPEGGDTDSEEHGQGKPGSSSTPPVDPDDPGRSKGDSETNGSDGKQGAQDDPTKPSDKGRDSKDNKKDSSTKESEGEDDSDEYDEDDMPGSASDKVSSSDSSKTPKTADELPIVPVALFGLVSLVALIKMRYLRQK